MRKWIEIFLSIFILLLISVLHAAVSNVKAPSMDALVSYLQDNWKSPEEYIISKFDDHDFVLLGEMHHIKPLVEFVGALIPHLYEAGVHNLGIEYGGYEDQDRVDKLLNSAKFNEDLAKEIQYNWCFSWAYKEYIELYRSAWELNKSLPENAPRFRIVLLDYSPRWNLIETMPSQEVIDKGIFYKGSRDEHMAKVVEKKFITKKEKALIYCGIMHAVTDYYQPLYDPEEKRLLGFNKKRLGNIIAEKIPDRVCTILFHIPWISLNKMAGIGLIYPVGGAIDEVMRNFHDIKRVGFDVKGTPFGKLLDKNSYYSVGYDNFTLSKICDGYVFLDHFENYKNCEIDPKFITEKKFEKIKQYLTPEDRKILKYPSDFLQRVAKDFKTERVFKQNNLK